MSSCLGDDKFDGITDDLPSFPLTKRVRRVKTGCVTCRIRRVKCDETKPHCQRCTSTGRQCDGYSSLPFSRRDLHAASLASSAVHASSDESSGSETAPLARIVSDPAFSNVVEKRYFQFFRQKTVTSTNILMNSRFWDRIVLQFCHIEPAVKHAVLALSSIHQLSEARHDANLALRHQRYANQHYQQALSAAQSLLQSSTPENIDRVLVACLVFTCYENVRGNYAASQMHTGSGRAIMAQHRERLRRPRRRNDLNEIQQLFARLDVAALAFSPSNSRYPYDTDSFHDTNPNLVPDSFDTIEEARAPLIDHIRWLLVVGRDGYCTALKNPSLYAILEPQRLRVKEHLVRWSSRFEEIAHRDQNASPILTRTLRIWHQLVTIDVEATYYGSELRYDKYANQYERLVFNAEEINKLLAQESSGSDFSFDLGITIPLFCVIERCRDPHIRRRALKAMHTGQKQEGTWGPGAAMAAEKWMLFEEHGLERVEKASDIPEWRRICSMDAAVNTELGTAEIIFDVTPSEGHEDELSMGFLGASRLDEAPAWNTVKPFSMGFGLTLSIRTQFEEEPAATMMAPEGGSMVDAMTIMPEPQQVTECRSRDDVVNRMSA